MTQRKIPSVLMKPVHIQSALLFVVLGLACAGASGMGQQLVPPSRPIPRSFFGMHIHHMVSPNGTSPLTPWPSVTVPEWRLWDARVTWPDLEPLKGQWRFDNLDKSLALAEQHNANVLLTLGLTPRWASARPQEPSGYQYGFAAEPNDLEDWRTFVKTVATRYKGRIHIYEVGNEPNVRKFWTGTVDQMLVLTREAHDIIKRIDPTALLVSPSATAGSGTPWLSEFLSKGGGEYVDIIGYHFYVTPKPPETMVPLVEKVKKIMQQNGAGDKPLWDTETGWFPPSQFDSGELAAAYLARSYLILWAEGVQRLYWYAWDNNKMSLQTTASDSTTLTPAGQAYDTIQKWLVGARMDWCNVDTDSTWTCQLNRNGSSQWIVWNPEQSKTIDLPAAWHIKNITPLVREPQALKGLSIQVGPIPQLLT